MARLRADYGANFFGDLKKCLDDTTWGEARAYLGAQLTLAENIQTRTGILIDDQAGLRNPGALAGRRRIAHDRGRPGRRCPRPRRGTRQQGRHPPPAPAGPRCRMP
jgi:hypothetical protein